jgi:hypothetical protein
LVMEKGIWSVAKNSTRFVTGWPADCSCGLIKASQ